MKYSKFQQGIVSAMKDILLSFFKVRILISQCKDPREICVSQCSLLRISKDTHDLALTEEYSSKRYSVWSANF